MRKSSTLYVGLDVRKDSTDISTAHAGPDLKAIMRAAPPERCGDASGMVAGALGSALVALCFGLAWVFGPVWAPGLGTSFALLGTLVRVARLFVEPAPA